jgi:TonB-dependent SusC/RagA subfamily outer membrane receptor
MKKQTFLILFLFFFISGYSQSHVLQGVIHTLDSIPLIGAEVTVASTNNTYLTNIEGRFVVECNSTDKLKIKADGFYSQKVKVSNQLKFVAINLKIKQNSDFRKYNIGYGQTDEKNRTSAISGITYKDVDFTKYSNISEIIRDNFAGVQVINGEILIRGANSLNSSSAPLIVVDGVIYNETISLIPPREVKSIDIIKDASAAVYGSRGSNGVVIIEMLKGGEK